MAMDKRLEKIFEDMKQNALGLDDVMPIGELTIHTLAPNLITAHTAPSISAQMRHSLSSPPACAT